LDTLTAARPEVRRNSPSDLDDAEQLIARRAQKPFRSCFSNDPIVTIRHMTIVKDTRAAVLRIEAERALHQGHWIFTTLMTANHDISGSVAGWAEAIEAVEDAGWQLYHWSASLDIHGNPQAYPLFRRRA
jgi:hypothetical protein